MYCKNCGGEIAEGNDFCPKCGSVVSAPTPTAGNFGNTKGAAVNVQGTPQKKFIFVAFFFPIVWCFVKNLWKHAIVLVACFGILIGCMVHFMNVADSYSDEIRQYRRMAKESRTNAEMYERLADDISRGSYDDNVGKGVICFLAIISIHTVCGVYFAVNGNDIIAKNGG